MWLAPGRLVRFASGYRMCDVQPRPCQSRCSAISSSRSQVWAGRKGKNQPPPSQPSDSTQPPTVSPDSSDSGRGKAAEAPGPKPAGVPVPPDSPILQAFEKLEQQSVYHQRMVMTASDPRMQQMMAQMGFMPAETITAGDVKQVSMHFKMPFDGQTEDFELRSVSSNGRIASKWLSPAKDRILATQDAQIDKQLAESEAQAATSIAKDLAMGPMGIASAAVQARAAAPMRPRPLRPENRPTSFGNGSARTAGDKPPKMTPRATRQPPPLTDLRVVGDDTIDDVAVTSYEFYVHEGGQFHGPMQMYVAKDSGLPVRMGMNDPRMQGSMQMDYFGFNDGGDFEVPACLAQK